MMMWVIKASEEPSPRTTLIRWPIASLAALTVPCKYQYFVWNQQFGQAIYFAIFSMCVLQLCRHETLVCVALFILITNKLKLIFTEMQVWASKIWPAGGHSLLPSQGDTNHSNRTSKQAHWLLLKGCGGPLLWLKGREVLTYEEDGVWKCVLVKLQCFIWLSNKQVLYETLLTPFYAVKQ